MQCLLQVLVYDLLQRALRRSEGLWSLWSIFLTTNNYSIVFRRRANHWSRFKNKRPKHCGDFSESLFGASLSDVTKMLLALRSFVSVNFASVKTISIFDFFLTLPQPFTEQKKFWR